MYIIQTDAATDETCIEIPRVTFHLSLPEAENWIRLELAQTKQRGKKKSFLKTSIGQEC